MTTLSKRARETSRAQDTRQPWCVSASRALQFLSSGQRLRLLGSHTLHPEHIGMPYGSLQVTSHTGVGGRS